MSQIILDFGSGNSCKNDKNYVKKMLDELKTVDTGKHEIIIKWQLFKKAGENIPLSHEIFEYAYNYAKKLGYKTTSSVFDKESLEFLLKFDIPFVKIANNRNLDWIMGEIKRKIPIVLSYGNVEELKVVRTYNTEKLLCVSGYPATAEAYEKTFDLVYYMKCDCGISDHTTNFDLFNKYKPSLIEFHYKLKDSTGLDAGEFARTPKQLSEIL